MSTQVLNVFGQIAIFWEIKLKKKKLNRRGGRGLAEARVLEANC